MANDLTCRELVDLITDYLEDVLPEAARQQFEQHLMGCDGCQNYVEQMRQTIHLTGILTEKDVPPRGQDALLETFRNWKNGS